MRQRRRMLAQKRDCVFTPHVYLYLSKVIFPLLSFLFLLSVLGNFAACASIPPNDDSGSGRYVPHPVAGMQQAPMDGGGNGSCFGPSAGDPVNLTTGEEQYAPEADITVYNPNGPSVVWSRLYNSLRAANEDPGNQGLPAADASEDFGRGWSHSYNYYIVYNSSVSPAIGAIILPNKGRIPFTVPVGSVRGDRLNVSSGAPCAIYTQPLSATTALVFRVHWSDGTQMYFVAPASDPNRFALVRLNNTRGQGLYLNYADTNLRRLASIYDDNSLALLTIERGNGLTQGITKVYDRYHRAVYYQRGPNGGASAGQLTNVSWLFSDTAAGPYNDRVAYNYTFKQNGAFTSPFLTGIYVPSPTGSGASAMSIEYDQTTLLVAALQDANVNRHLYFYVASDTTKTEVWKSGFRRFSQSVVFDTNMNVKKVLSGEDLALNRPAQTVAENTYPTGLTDNPFRPTTVQLYDGVAGSQSTLAHSYLWDSYGNLTLSQNWRNKSAYDYDFTDSNFPAGLPKKRRERVGANSTSGGIDFDTLYYNGYGEISQTTSISPTAAQSDATPLVSENYTYTAMGNVASIQTPGAPSSRTYTLNYTNDTSQGYSQTEKMGQPLVVTDPAGHETHFRYNEMGMVTDTFDHFGYITSYAYNITGQLTDVRFSGLPNKQRYRIHYEIAYPGGLTKETQVFDETGTQVQKVVYTYGLEGELLAVSGDTAQAASYVYDSMYHIAKFRDGKGNETNYTYDDLTGFLTKVQYPGGEHFDYVTDRIGRVTQQTDSKGKSAKYYYYGTAGELSRIEYTDSNPDFYPGYVNNVRRYVDLGYNWNSQVGFINEGWTNRVFSYNYAGVLLEDLKQFSVAAGSIRYTYYPDGSRNTMNVPIGEGGGTFTYLYDNTGKMLSLTNPFGEKTAYAYAANDWLTGQTISVNNTTLYNTDYGYDNLQRLTRLIQRRGAATLADFGGPQPQYAMQYDGASNRTQVNVWSSLDYSPLPFIGSTTYSFTDASQPNQPRYARLLQETSSRFKTGGYANTYNYDAAGNLSKFSNAEGRAWFGFTYNGNNQVEYLPGMTYDTQGNLTARLTSGAITYDWEDRATQFRGVGGVDASLLQNGYGSDGLAVWRMGKNNAIPYRAYLYDGQTPIIEMDGSSATTVVAVNTFGPDGLLSRRTGTFTAPAASANSSTSTPVEDTAGGNDTPSNALPPAPPVATGKTPPSSNASAAVPLAGVSSSVFYLFDERGNTSLRLDSSGNVLSAHVTDAYGATASQDYVGGAGTDTDPYTGFGAEYGYFREPGLNLYRCGYRVYDVANARWITRDPIGYDGGANLYEYAGGNPVMNFDPSGLKLELVQFKKGWFSDEYVPASATDQAKFRAVLKYLSQDKAFAEIIRTLEVSPLVFRVKVTRNLYGYEYTPGDRMIGWNPHANATIVDNYGNETPFRLSAGLLLGHEMAHAYDHLCDPKFGERFANKLGNNFHNAEEEYVIRKFENVFARKFGDGFRNNHLGNPFYVK